MEYVGTFFSLNHACVRWNRKEVKLKIYISKGENIKSGHSFEFRISGGQTTEKFTVCSHRASC